MDPTVFEKLLDDDSFVSMLQKRLGTLNKADTISQATNLLWHDVSNVVQFLYPYKQLTPIISSLPRVQGDGSAYSWKRITSINPNNISAGVSEGNRGARIGLTEQDLTAAFKTLGLESSVTFEARLGGRQLTPDNMGTAVYSTLRSLRIQEEQIVVNGNSSIPLGTTPTPTMTATGADGTFGAVPVYIGVVALTGMGLQGYRTYNSTTSTGGVPGRITKTNADGSSDTFGGGSAAPSAIATITPGATEHIVATVAAVTGAVAYAWYVGTTNAAASMYLAGISQSNRVVLLSAPASTNQPMSALYVSAAAVDNSTNVLIPDGIINQIWGAAGPDPGRNMATSTTTVSGITYSNSGSILYAMAAGNTGLTIDGSDIAELDAVFEAAWEQYKLGYSKIMMSARTMLQTFGVMLNAANSGNASWRMLFDADETTGRIVAGRKVTSYQNKFTNETLDVCVHPYIPPGMIILWSDRIPYEVSNLNNLFEARVRQDYYQIPWPLATRRYEYGVYVDETFPMYFAPAFGMIYNINPAAGNQSF